MNNSKKILCIGEILWDALPVGLFLGGAPFNVAFHLQQLEEEALIVSRVGDDRLGTEALRRVKQKQLSTKFIQKDSQFETGFVEVEIDERGSPNYMFPQPVAWDNIELTDSVEKVLSETWALVYGSLAQRDQKSRSTLHALLDNDILKVLDLNLRKPFYDKEIIKESLFAADILKMNDEELQILKNWFSLPRSEKKAVEAIVDLFGCSTVAITKSGQGAILFHDNKWITHPGFDIEVKDTVGAGDAFLAALLQGIRTNRKIDDLLIFANATGALTASSDGGSPTYNNDDVEYLIADPQQI